MSERGNKDEEDKSMTMPPHLSENLSDEVASMWEIPQIYQFLCLAKETLGIQQLSMYEMERMLSMPKASKQLASIMTSLLCLPMSKTKLRTVPPMPYQFWTNVLTQKALTWFKVYQTKEKDTVKILEMTGVEPEFWKIFPQSELITERKFDELSLRERVWLLKTVCDTLIHTRRTLQDEVAKRYLDDDNEMVLGKDRHGARYIYFPSFLDNADLRVYRHSLDNKILLSLKQANKKSKLKIERITCEKKVVKRKRNSWRYGRLPVKSKKKLPKTRTDTDQIKDDQNGESHGFSDVKKQENGKNYGNEKENLNEDEGENEKEKSDRAASDTNCKDGSLPVALSEPTSKARDDDSTQEKTEGPKSDDGNISEIVPSAVNENSIDAGQMPMQTKGGDDDEQDSEDIIKVNRVNENNADEDIREELTSRKQIEEFNRMIMDLGESSFRLVADSLDGLRDLLTCLKVQNYPEGHGTVACEVQLIRKINNLIEEVEKIESTLIESKKQARSRLEQEWINFSNDGKEGARDDKDEGSSNTWVIGSHGHPTCDDTVSKLEIVVDSQQVSGGKIDIKVEKKDEDLSHNPEDESRRVLRARGISSYVEPFFTTSEESDESDAEHTMGLSDPIESLSAKTLPTPPRRELGESSAADSDQDWQLPSSRKRRRKRSSSSKRQKLQQNKSTPVSSRGSTTLLPAVDLINTDSQTRMDSLNNATMPVQHPVNNIKITSVHSESNRKEKVPIIDSVTTGKANNNSLSSGMQQNYVIVNAGNGPVNYVVMPQGNPQQRQQQQQQQQQHQTAQSSSQNYYLPNPQGYMVAAEPHARHYRDAYGSPSNLPTMIIQPPYIPQTNNFVQYQPIAPSISNIYHGTVVPGPTPRQPNRDIQIRSVRPRLQPRAPAGAVIRSTIPFRGAAVRPPPSGGVRATSQPRAVIPRGPRPSSSQSKPSKTKQISTKVDKPATKTTSLIVLSDSDDEIEMIITEKSGTAEKSGKTIQNVQNRRKGPTTIPHTSQVTKLNKSLLPAQIIQRMSQGGISITPIKPKSPEKTSISNGGGTQLVVVVNETGSHYALALPNGSKLILTPEQVAQIRASNGGKLVL